MKFITLLFTFLFVTLLVDAQVSKTVELTAGTLSTTLTDEELSAITDLTITGTMDARDFRTIRDSMGYIAVLDISEVNIVAYEGMDGTNNYGNQYDTWGRFPEDEIPIGSFSEKVSLTAIEFPLSCQSIATAAFSQCTRLAGELQLPASISRIGVNAFILCSSLTGHVSIPPLVTVLESGTFSQCTGITSVTIPPAVQRIESGVFSGCTGLQLIEVQLLTPVLITPNQGVFNGVDMGNCTLQVPYGTKELYESAQVWNEFSNIVEQESGFLLSGTSLSFDNEGGTDNSIQIKANVDWQVTSDQEWLSVSPTSGDGDQTLTVSVEANTSISPREGTLLFTSEGFSSQSIEVQQVGTTTAISITPGSLSEALSEEEKQSISSLTLTGQMDARDFRTIRIEMPLLEELDITEVDIVAYTDTTYDNNILHPADAIPFDVHEWIDEPQTSYALAGHPTLAHIKLPNSLNTIGYRAFYGCELITVEMQSSVERIGIEAFLGCNSLTDINLPESLILIEEAAFKWCTSLASIDLPSSLEKIDYETFANSGLESMVIPSTITVIEDNAFTGCSLLKSVDLSSSLTIIGYEVFKDCSSLTSVGIPPLVTLIEEFAFRGCVALEKVTLPESVTQIGPAAFSDCTSLDTIYSYAVNPPDLNISTGWDVFDNVNKSECLVYVPVGSKDLYASAYGWEEFDNIIELGEFRLEETTVTLDATANSEATVKLHSSLSWTASSDQQWLSVSPESGEGGQLLTLTAQANMGTARTAIITIEAQGMEPLTITVTQHALATGIDQVAQDHLSLDCYPNPFKKELSIEIVNPSLREVTVEIYSILGQKIRSLAQAQKGTTINCTWDGKDESGQKVRNGLYILKMGKLSKQVLFNGN